MDELIRFFGAYPELGILIILVLLVTGAWLGVRTQQRWHLWKHKRRLKKGGKAEKWAHRALMDDGFEIVGEQVRAPVRMAIDGEWLEREVRLDLLAARDGERFAVEVKSGQQAFDPGVAPIRRQMLEYVLVFGLDGILLADYNTQTFHTVEFEWTANPNHPPEDKEGDGAEPQQD